MAGNGFNIFDYVDEMKKAGMPHEQADIFAKALHGVASESAATKHDLEFAKLELKKDIEIVRKDIETVRAELKQDIKSLEDKISLRMRNAMYLTIGTTVSSLVGLILFFAKTGVLSIR